VFSRREGETILSHAYAEPPFRVGRWFREGAGTHLIVAWSAPGIFGGDDFEQRIHLEPGARVRLTSQSALQVHPAAGRMAQLRSTYSVDAGAVLSCQWDPVIPFAGARFDQQIAIALARDASLYWSDALMAGREARGERWAFEALGHELRITREAQAEYLERYQLTGANARQPRTWVAGDSCYFGTIVNSGPITGAPGAERLHCELRAVAGVRAAADALDARLLVVRLMAAHGVGFHEARELARRAIFRTGS
jgi:urease accessory protein